MSKTRLEGTPANDETDPTGRLRIIIYRLMQDRKELYDALNRVTSRGCGCRQCKDSRELLAAYERLSDE